MDTTNAENPPTNKPSGSQTSLSVRTPATRKQILARVASLELLYGRQAMSDTERRVWLETYCEDLNGRSDDQIADACKRYRQNGENRYFPTPGALLDLMKNPYADPPTVSRGSDLHSRLGFGGGACKCQRCTSLARSDGFFVAPAENYKRAAKDREQMAYFTESQTVSSRLDEAETHKRFLMTQDLVRDHGWEWEAARRKVMVDRARALYPEFKVWPVLGNESGAEPPRHERATGAA